MSKTALWTAEEVAQATGGRMGAPFVATGVSIDSRNIAQGDLFVALQGPSFDGNDYVAAAQRAGAAGALVSRPFEGAVVQVDDTLAGLCALAATARQRSAAKVVAVTGSVGKTSTKEGLARVFAAQGRAHATAGNLNNHWGLPLSVARMPADTQYAVFEMGMNHAGEIAPLSVLARPHVAIVTTVEAVHLENFADISGIADAKAEIFAGLEPGGTAVLNRDNGQFERLAAAARARGASVLSFGEHGAAEARLIKVALHGSCSCVAAEIMGQAITYKIGAPGRHWVMNSLAILAATRLVGGDLGLAGLALAEIAAPEGRGKRHQANIGANLFELIDDSYNASPASMRAAFAILAAAKPGPRGRRIAVLGDMLELGPEAAALHAGLAADLDAAKVDRVFTAGPLMQHLHDALPPQRRGAHGAKSIDLVAPLLDQLRGGDVVLVKGSHGSRMHLVVEALLADGGRTNGNHRHAARG